MNFLSFPEPFARQSAEQAARDYQRGDRQNVGRDRLCYQNPDGSLRPVYDPYRPAYPEGSTPGTGTITRTKEYYPNDSTGYAYHVSDFKPLACNL